MSAENPGGLSALERDLAVLPGIVEARATPRMLRLLATRLESRLRRERRQNDSPVGYLAAPGPSAVAIVADAAAAHCALCGLEDVWL